jgi:predicted nucleotidyltransferase
MFTIERLKYRELKQPRKKYNVKELYLFGSAVSSELSEDSDLDFVDLFDRQRYGGALSNLWDLNSIWSKFLIVR